MGMVASPMLNNQNYQKGGEAIMKRIERLNSRRLRGFNEIEFRNYHALSRKFFYNKRDTMVSYGFLPKI
jgi:hypothetical protein